MEANKNETSPIEYPALSKTFEQRKSGRYYYMKINDKPVVVAVPKSYKPSGKIVVHFHGYLQRSIDLRASSLETFLFLSATEKVNPEYIVVMPFGKFGRQGAYSLGRDYGSMMKVKYLLDGILPKLGVPMTDVIFSGHSAAGSVIRSLIAEQVATKFADERFKTVFLYDALYSTDVKPFNEWLKDANHRMFNASPKFSTTYKNAKAIHSDWGNYENLTTASDLDHYELVNPSYIEFLRKVREKSGIANGA